MRVKTQNVYLTIILFFCCNLVSSAQSLRAGWTAFPKRPTEDKTGELAWQRLTIGLNYPLYRKTDLERKRIQLLSVNGNVAYNYMRYTFLPRDLHNFQASIGLTYILLSQKNRWLINATPFWSAPATSFAYSRSGMLGMGWYQRQVNTHWSYHLGTLYIKARQHFIVPLAGFHYRFNVHDQIQVNLPLNIAYIHQPDVVTKHRISAGFNGFFSQTPFISDESYLRLRQLIVQYTFTKETPKHIKWFVSGGITAARHITVANTPVGSHEARIKAGIRFEAGLTLPLRKQAKPLALPEPDLFRLDELSADEIEEWLNDE